MIKATLYDHATVLKVNILGTIAICGEPLVGDILRVRGLPDRDPNELVSLHVQKREWFVNHECGPKGIDRSELHLFVVEIK